GDGLMEEVDGDGLLAEAADVLAVDGEEPAARRRITRYQGLQREDFRDEIRRIDELYSAGDAVAVEVLRIGEREEGGVVDGFEQTETGNARGRKARGARSLFRHDFGLVARHRTILDLWPAVGQHRIETIALVAPESRQIEDGMPVAIPRVAGAAGVRNEDGAEAVADAKDAVELFVAPEEGRPLGGRKALDRPIEQFLIGWSGRKHLASHQ